MRIVFIMSILIDFLYLVYCVENNKIKHHKVTSHIYMHNSLMSDRAITAIILAAQAQGGYFFYTDPQC